MISGKLFNSAAFILLFANLVNSVEFTFDLADNAEDCFYEEVRKNQSASLEFQVMQIYFHGT